MQCKYIINSNKRCKLKAIEQGLCHKHSNIQNFKFPKPQNCPICFSSLHQTSQPLDCGHWIHKTCIQKTCKPECPVCRTKLNIKIKPQLTKSSSNESLDLDDLLDHINEISEDNDNLQRIEIPYENLISAYVMYQLYKMYTLITNPNTNLLALNHFISGMINNIIPINHPQHFGITISLGERLNDIIYTLLN